MVALYAPNLKKKHWKEIFSNKNMISLIRNYFSYENLIDFDFWSAFISFITIEIPGTCESLKIKHAHPIKNNPIAICDLPVVL